MDSFTHIVLGACTGELIAGKQLGRKALLWGALAQSIPDFDFIFSFFLDPSSDLLAHRGITHSWTFALLITLLLSWLCMKGKNNVSSENPMTRGRWIALWGTELGMHLLLDACNVYGTAFWMPFSDQRIAWNLLFVVDPLFTIIPFIAAFVLWFVRKKEKTRKVWAWAALGICAGYIVFSGHNKSEVNGEILRQAQNQGIKTGRYFSTPTPFNNLLWYTILPADSGYYITYRSVMDKDTAVKFHYVTQNRRLFSDVYNYSEFARLLLFSDGWFTLERQGNALRFNDMRFGQVHGWQNPGADFTFNFYLDRPEANNLVIQRGRFKKWDKTIFKAYLQRIEGR